MAVIQEAGFVLMDHPPYSPALTPSDFYLFPRLKKHLRAHKVEDDDEVVATVHDFFK